MGYLAEGGKLPCSSDELSAWAQAACARILSLAAGRTHRILEIGCGTGMLALQLTAAGLEYAGIDPVASAVERLATELPQASFEVGTACSVPARLLTGRLVVINSVAQYFPSQHYLQAVLERCHRHGAVGVFVGDVRAAELLAHQRRALLISPHAAEQELVPPLELFHASPFPCVRVLLHADGSRSHFERFRLDVFLEGQPFSTPPDAPSSTHSAAQPASPPPPPERVWTPAERFDTAGWVHRVPNAAVSVHRVPNAAVSVHRVPNAAATPPPPPPQPPDPTTLVAPNGAAQKSADDLSRAVVWLSDVVHTAEAAGLLVEARPSESSEEMEVLLVSREAAEQYATAHATVHAKVHATAQCASSPSPKPATTAVVRMPFCAAFHQREARCCVRAQLCRALPPAEQVRVVFWEPSSGNDDHINEAADLQPQQQLPTPPSPRSPLPLQQPTPPLQQTLRQLEQQTLAIAHELTGTAGVTLDTPLMQAGVVRVRRDGTPRVL